MQILLINLNHILFLSVHINLSQIYPLVLAHFMDILNLLRNKTRVRKSLKARCFIEGFALIGYPYEAHKEVQWLMIQTRQKIIDDSVQKFEVLHDMKLKVEKLFKANEIRSSRSIKKSLHELFRYHESEYTLLHKT